MVHDQQSPARVAAVRAVAVLPRSEEIASENMVYAELYGDRPSGVRRFARGAS
jgi:hypothetical protein